jgi:hypothetical protein
MTEQEIKQLLDKLADLYSAKDAIMLQKQDLIDSILTPEIKAKIAEIDAEFADKASVVVDTIAALEAESKTAVLELGTTVKGAYLQAVWNKGRVSWDTKSLDGYMAAHPELSQFRKVGEASVSLRKI